MVTVAKNKGKQSKRPWRRPFFDDGRTTLGKRRRLPHRHQREHLQADGGSQERAGGLPFFDLSCEGDHGRIDSRKAAVEAISPVTAGLLGARSAVTVRRDWSEKKEPKTARSHTHFFELYHRHPAKALNLLLHSRPVL